MLRVLHKLLLRLPPETAHELAIQSLTKWLRTAPKALTAVPPHRGPGISIRGGGRLVFRHRLGLAAGFDKNAEVFPAMLKFGFAFVEIGTVTPQPQSGNPRPRLWRVPPGNLVNALGFNSRGLAEVCENLTQLSPLRGNSPVFANIGKNKDTQNEEAVSDYRQGFSLLDPWVDGFVINLSSPNTVGLRDLQSEAFLEALAAHAPRNKPIWVKLAPDLANTALEALADYVGRSSVYTGLVLTNTSRALAERAGFSSGGLSGESLFSRSLECVQLARGPLREKTLVGVGGVNSPERAVQMRQSGADLIEVYTGMVYGGNRWVKRMAQSIAE